MIKPILELKNKIKELTCSKKKPLVLEYLEFHIVDHCNLKCKGCGHFSNITQENFISPQDIGKRLSRLNKMFDKVAGIRMMGGEPLLHPEINEILKIARESVPDTLITLVTNGLLVQNMSPEFWETCRKYRITLDMTVYPPMKEKVPDIVELGKANNVYIHVAHSADEFRGGLNLKGDSDKQKTFAACKACGLCTILKDDNIYLCATASHIENFNKKFNKNIAEGKGINIFKNDAKAILKYLEKPEKVCSYCTSKYRIFKWEITKNANENDWNGIMDEETQIQKV